MASAPNNNLKILFQKYLRKNRSPPSTFHLSRHLQDQTPDQIYLQIVETKDHDGSTVVHIAAVMNHSETLQCLFDSLDVTKVFQMIKLQNAHGHTAIHGAARFGHVDALKFLLCSDSEKNYELLEVRDERDGCTAIHLAALYGHIEAMKLMLNTVSAANQIILLDIRDGDNETVLEAAESQEQINSISFIRRHIVEAEKRDRKGLENRIKQNEDEIRNLKRISEVHGELLQQKADKPSAVSMPPTDSDVDAVQESHVPVTTSVFAVPATDEEVPVPISDTHTPDNDHGSGSTVSTDEHERSRPGCSSPPQTTIIQVTGEG